MIERKNWKTMAAVGLAGTAAMGVTGGLAAAPAPAAPAPATQAARLNILWLIAEDVGTQMGCYGYKNISTPNIDKLAAQGVRYTHAYNTNPVCSPSRSAFMTGMYQYSIASQDHRTTNKQPLPEGVRVLPDWLHDVGYFSGNLVQMPAGVDFQGTGKFDWNFKRPGKAFDTDTWDDLKGHQPFYAQINFSETHRMFRAPAKTDPSKVVVPPYYPDTPVSRADWAKYLDSIIELDRKVGEVLHQLDKDGLADNTIVLFFGDNGEANVRGKQFCYEEGFITPLVIRWPKNFPAPSQIKQGMVDDRFIESVDFAPTMLAIAGAKKPVKMQGRNFLGAQAEAPRESVFGGRDRCDETVMHIRSVRDKRYRYIRNFTPNVPFLAPNKYKENEYPVWNLLKEMHAQGKLTPAQDFLCQPTQPAEELYDLQSDPWEIHNLAADSKSAAALQHMRGLLQSSLQTAGDRYGVRMMRVGVK